MERLIYSGGQVTTGKRRYNEKYFMSKVISLRDVQDMISNGQDVTHLPADAIITPSANDYLYELQMNGSAKTAQAAQAAPVAASGEKFSPPAKQLNSKSPKSELEAFFNSPYVHNLKEQICDMGHRLWQRAYVDGNGGNMSIRVGEDIVLCTPTLVSKGSLQPSDMCLVDFEGNQLCGTKKTHQRSAHAPTDDEAPASGQGRLPLPPALRHGVRRHRHRPADLHAAGI